LTADFILEERLFERGITRGKRKGGDSGTPVLAIFNNIQRVDKFGAINSPSTPTTIRYAPF